MAEYLIQEETLKDVADKIRLYSTTVEDNGHKYKDGYVNGTEPVEGKIEVIFWENIDNLSQACQTENYRNADYGSNIIGCDFGTHNGVYVPRILLGDDGSYCYYVGTVKLFGEFYDKWRKIEEAGLDGNTDPTVIYRPDSPVKKYFYTNQIIERKTEDKISPKDFAKKIEQIYQESGRGGN